MYIYSYTDPKDNKNYIKAVTNEGDEQAIVEFANRNGYKIEPRIITEDTHPHKGEVEYSFVDTGKTYEEIKTELQYFLKSNSRINN